MVMEVYHSVTYGLLRHLGTSGVKLEFNGKTDVFGNAVLYSIEDGYIVVYAKSLMEVNMNTEELIVQLIECIKNSLELGYYAPKLIIYKSERLRKSVYFKKEIKRDDFERTFRRGKGVSLWKSSSQ